ncbi:hypothetical protein AM500_19725 [Bacillus sp. FJAT-18017]|uniref:CBO0543 family protein n=1 Tax=Bacillus sp. FJAT-18017 TaxID=1705566 RepID=UPI0006B06226|nr:CBO0543 family protein [Bacillus sp. FJAT-18017]ALC91761.1 hypothetical protein AM500_19725 [Bacillus sp. FJAT-18017]
MKKKYEITFLKTLIVFGIAFFFNILRKPPIKDWLIVFFLKGYISSFLDVIVVKKGYVAYPVNLFKAFNISVVFSYLLYPVICVYFNKATKQSNILVVLFKNVLFTTPMVLAETWLEKHTNLIKYKKGWNWRHSYASIFGTFLAVRTIAYIINTIARKKI